MAGDILGLPDGHRLGRTSIETDPVTGLPVEVTEVITGKSAAGLGGGKAVAVRQRDPGHGTAHINMEALWFLCLYLKNHVAVALVIEAARRYKLEMEPLALTYVLQQRLGLTKRGTRTALDALEAASESLGWVIVTRSGHRAATIAVTELGFRHLWANTPGRKATR